MVDASAHKTRSALKMGSAMMTKRAKHVPKAKFASAACVMLQTGLAENANPTNSLTLRKNAVVQVKLIFFHENRFFSVTNPNTMA